MEKFEESLKDMADLFVVKREETERGTCYVVVNATRKEYASAWYFVFKAAMKECAALQAKANAKVDESKR